MKRWNGKFNKSPELYEASPDYHGDGIFRLEYAYEYWWEDMRAREVRRLVESAFRDGYNRRKDEEEEEDKK